MFLLDGEDREQDVSFAELDAQARRVAALLEGCVEPGDPVVLVHPSGPEYVFALFGTLYAGAIAVPAYPPDLRRRASTMQRLEALLHDASASVVLTTGHAEALAAMIAAQGIRGARVLDSTQPGEQMSEPVATGADAPALLQYTSGSTGDPKGVVLSQANLAHNAEMWHAHFGVEEQLPLVSWLPLYHDMGLLTSVVLPVTHGKRSVIMSPLHFLQQPHRWLRAIGKYGAGVSGAPNFAYDLCVRRVTFEQRATLDLRSWGCAFSGAEPVRSQTLERFAKAFAPAGFREEALMVGWGLAEATCLVTGGPRPRVLGLDREALLLGRAVPAPSPERERRVVSCGPVLEDQELIVVDSTSGRRLPEGELGELWVRGPSVGAGYWRRSEETAAVFHRRTDDGDGPWLATGDLGFTDRGEVFVLGRRKDILIIRGRNHVPSDLEATAEASHPAVRAGCSAAFGIGDDEGEEALVIACEVDLGEAVSHEIRAAVQTAIMQEHGVGPADILLLAPKSIPKTSSGKIQRSAARLAYLSGEITRAI